MKWNIEQRMKFRDIIGTGTVQNDSSRWNERHARGNDMRDRGRHPRRIPLVGLQLHIINMH
jgi:hypothetical protein